MDRWIELRRVAQAGKVDDPRWYRVHRGLSIHLTRVMLRAGFRANQVSGLMMAVAAAGAALLASLWPAANLVGFALLYLAFLLDKVDGEIARLRGAQSARGILLDRFHHRIVEPAIFAAAALHEYRLTLSVVPVAAGLVTMLLANAIEENQQLAPFILYKRLREGGHLLESWPRSRSRDLTLAAAVLRPLKAFRMLIVALPILLLCYLAESAAHLLELLEHQVVVVSLVRNLLDQGVNVSIGSENEIEELRDCAIVLAPYRVEGEFAGTVGVLGPTRMDYRRTIGAVAAVSQQLGRLLTPVD